MSKKIREYTGEGINVQFDVQRCIHARECVRGLPAVFDVEKRPWVQPDNAAADEVAEVVMRCPTGALHFTRKDGGAEEPTPEGNTITLAEDGPLYLRGDIQLGEDFSDTRMALCRCGASNNKPFCDNSHQETDFTAPATVTQIKLEPTDGVTHLGISPAPNGPLLLNGNFEIHNAQGETVYRDSKAALCRCGGSGDKPFCDGTHTKIGFTAD